MLIPKIRWVVVAEVLLALVLADIGSAQQPQAGPTDKPPQSTGETLIIGTTTLRLGMSKDSVLPALALQYDVAPAFPGCKLDLPECRRYSIMAGKSGAVGELEFNAQGNLVAVAKHWTPEFRHYSDGELGRALFTLIGSLIIEGKSACSINASQSHSVELKGQPPGPGWVFRDAIIQCGHKRIDISVPTQPDGTDSMGITEEIGNPWR